MGIRLLCSWPEGEGQDRRWAAWKGWGTYCLLHSLVQFFLSAAGDVDFCAVGFEGLGDDETEAGSWARSVNQSDGILVSFLPSAGDDRNESGHIVETLGAVRRCSAGRHAG